MNGCTADIPAVENGCIMGFDGSQWNLMGKCPLKWGHPWRNVANWGDVPALFWGGLMLDLGCG
jgi:hypothetical protein